MRRKNISPQRGVTSRRKAEALILAGRVKVNGKTVTALGTKVDPEQDLVWVDGKEIQLKEEFCYYLFYKPEKVITSVSDPHGRRVVSDFFPSEPRLFPVGRLDFMTSGLLLMTNDGEFMNYMIHPRHEVDKTYQVLVKGHPKESQFDRLRKGIMLDGKITKMALVNSIVPKRNNCQFLITIQEGRNRQIRRMCEAIDHPVLSLKRVRMGSLTLNGLRPGEYRSLTKDEINNLFQRRT